jgi:hypothetical protein
MYLIFLITPMICADPCTQINLKLLACITSPELLGAIIDTLRRHADIWTCMDSDGPLLDALCVSHEAWNWNTRRAQSRPLLCLLIEFVDHPNMPQAAKDRVNEDALALMQAHILGYLS